MKKIVLLFVLLVSLSSCMRIAQFNVKEINDLKVTSVSLTGIKTVASFTFESNKTTSFWLDKLDLTVRLNESDLCRVEVTEKIKIITNDIRVVIPFTIAFEENILRAIKKENILDKAVINGVIVIKNGVLKKKIKVRNVPIKEFLEGYNSKFNEMNLEGIDINNLLK